MGTSVPSSPSHQDHQNLGWGFPGIWGCSREGVPDLGECGPPQSSHLTLLPRFQCVQYQLSPLHPWCEDKSDWGCPPILGLSNRPFVPYVPRFIFLCILAPFFCSEIFRKFSPSFSFLHIKKKVSFSSKKIIIIQVTFWPPLLSDVCSIRGYGCIFDEKGIFFMGQSVRFCPKQDYHLIILGSRDA